MTKNHTITIQPISETIEGSHGRESTHYQEKVACSCKKLNVLSFHEDATISLIEEHEHDVMMEVLGLNFKTIRKPEIRK